MRSSIPKCPVPDRLSRIRAAMREERLDALIINHSANVVYATGFEGIADAGNPHVALVTSETATVYIDSRYYEVASGQAVATQWEAVLARHEVRAKTIEALAEQRTTQKVHRIGIEDTVSYGAFCRWREELAESIKGGEVVATRQLVEECRAIKEADEIARIATAQRIADETFAHILGMVKPGVTERAIAFELEFALRARGAEAISFPVIVAAGMNGSMAHAMPSDYAIQEGDLVTMDFGAVVDGYHSDMTRTVCVGRASDRQREVYLTVLAAQEAALKRLKAGVACADIDSAARAVIEAAGYGEFFGHGTGHGVGLAIHERPNCSPNSEDTYDTGMLTTVEPGIYIPGEVGVRIEDLVLVTETGYHNLTTSPKELVELGV
ncbi:MAG: Xaa-Pro peptidase family protein [Coriobacteriia bacterium]|nr:Xaa-Pro peptidase family protein [Coriobacteriia bacterium]